MKIFVLIASFPDWVLRLRSNLIKAILARGFTVHVVVEDVPMGSEIRRRIEDLGVQVHDLPLSRTGMNPIADFRTFIGLYRLMRNIRPDIVLGYTIKPVIYGLLASQLAHVPQRFALITGLGYAFTGVASGTRLLVQRLVVHLYKLSLYKVSMVFFQNPDDRDLFYAQKILSNSTPVSVVNGSGIDISEYTPAPLPNSVRFLLIARLLRCKGIVEYVEAAKRIRSNHPDVEFDLVGWIYENPDAISQNELDAWIQDSTINYLGRVDDVRPAIANCSVYVLPSYREGTSRTVLEAMAMGRAIITTDAPGCRETVQNDDNGFLVTPQSVDDLVAAIQCFIDNPALIEKMGKRSREIAEIKYDVNKVNEHMLKDMGIA